jgi:FlaG/FlaF family flagellin (archaellin)
MIKRKSTLILMMLAGCCVTAEAGMFGLNGSYSTVTFANGGDVMAGNTAGWSDSETVSGQVGNISSLSVNLNITGGFNGSLYGYLEYDGVIVTLLNRVGVVSGNAFGYGDSGFDITLSSSSANSVHSYQSGSYVLNGSGQLTGIWAPDGNTVSPLSSPSSFNANPSTAGLTSFNGLNGDGTWTLFLADVVSGGGDPGVVSWGLEINSVPEPTNVALGIFGVCAVAGRLRAGWKKSRATSKSIDERI